MSRLLVRASTAIFIALLLAACGGTDAVNNTSPPSTSPAAAPTLTSIEITPSAGSTPAGTSMQLAATGTYSDGSHADLSNQVAWVSSDTAVANVAANGKVNAFVAGSATLTASLAGVTSSATLKVTAPVLVLVEVTPPAPSVASGRSLQLTATGIYSDNSTQNLSTQVAWSSSNAGIASIAAGGLASAHGSGTTTITASKAGITGNTVLTVTSAVLTAIEVTPTVPSVAKGLTLKFTAMGIFSDNSTENLTTQVVWKSSDGNVATVNSASGLATAVGVGGATISATIGSISGNTVLTVTPAILETIQVTPTTPSYAKGVSAQLMATGIFSDQSTQDLTDQAAWASTNSAVATVSSVSGSQGVLHATGIGSATVSASVGAISGSTVVTVTPAVLVSIQISPPAPSTPKGLTQQFSATGIYTDGTTQNLTSTATWASTVATVATISNASGSKGSAYAAGVGSTTISASLGQVSGTAAFAVTPAALVSIQVGPANPSVAKGVPESFAATGTYTDNTTQDVTTMATWQSSTLAVATVGNAPGTQGRATTLAIGTTSISATIGSISGATSLTVTPAVLVSIQVTAATATVAQGLTDQLTATGTYTDQSTQNLTDGVTWVSATTSVATVSNAAGSKGLATAVSNNGSSLMTATKGSISGSFSLTVTAAVLQSITISPLDPSVAKGIAQPFDATGHYSDLTARDVTTEVVWQSSNGAAAMIAANGVASTVGTGGTLISATIGSVSASTTLTVTAATVAAVNVTPGSTTLAIGATQTFVATATYTDSTQAPLGAGQVSWASSSPGIASIGPANGTATGIQDGSNVTITATSTNGTAGTATISSVFASYDHGPQSVYAILSTCQGSSCHTASNNVWQYSNPSATYTSLTDHVISTGSPASSDLYMQACTIVPPATAPAMPDPTLAGYNASVNFVLTAAQCAIISQWISDGAPNN